MSLFVIADPHLSLGVNKPMHIFGPHWQDHDDKLRQSWLELISDDDTVIIPGDISWGMHLIEALPDLQFLHALPGRKLLSRGNHDYWWTSLRKMEQFCQRHELDSIGFLRNNAVEIEDDLICATRGWILPDDSEFTAADEKILAREAGRLKLSLEAAAAIRKPQQRLIVCLHYPPLTRTLARSVLTDLMQEYDTDICCYGHIHASGSPLALAGKELEGIKYWLASADQIGFKPLRL